MSDTPSCYGAMFPNLECLEENTPCRGKAFAVLVRSLGIGVHSREVTVDPVQWETCQGCPAYRSCYDLSMALFSLREGLARQ